MIWRTCASVSRSSARRAYSTRAVGFVAPAATSPRYCGRVGVVAELAQAAGQLGGGAERRHAVAADQSRDRRVIDARLLGELPLRHLLGLELGSQPFVERSAVLARHCGVGALRWVSGGRLPRCPNYPGRRRARLYHPFVPGCRARPVGAGRRSEVPGARRTAVDAPGLQPVSGPRRPAGRVARRACALRPQAARLGRDAYTIEPSTMIENTLIARSSERDRRRLGQRHAVGDRQHADDARLHDARGPPG